MKKLLQFRKAVGRESKEGYAQLTCRYHARRVRRQRRQRNTKVAAHAHVAIRGANTVVDVSALLRCLAETHVLQRLRNPDQVNSLLAVFHGQGLDEQDRVHFFRPRRRAGRLRSSHR